MLFSFLFLWQLFDFKYFFPLNIWLADIPQINHSTHAPILSVHSVWEFEQKYDHTLCNHGNKLWGIMMIYKNNIMILILIICIGYKYTWPYTILGGSMLMKIICFYYSNFYSCIQFWRLSQSYKTNFPKWALFFLNS